MGVVATTVEKQIEILENRGLELDLGNEKVKEILLDIGYYRLGFYWNPFEKKGHDSHEFIEGSKFSDVVSLYYLDVDLRNLLLKYLNRIEINFKTCLIYNVSNKYSNSPTWFIDPRVVSSDFISTVDKYYNDSFKKNNKAIKKHHLKYLNHKYAPAWKTLEFFTFGTILELYLSLKDDRLKLDIANKYGINTVNTFENHLRTIIFIRNTCAHGGVVFDLKTPKGIIKIPEINILPNDRHSLYGSIKLIKFYINKISYNRKEELKDTIENIMLKHKNNSTLTNIIENIIGYKY